MWGRKEEKIYGTAQEKAAGSHLGKNMKKLIWSKIESGRRTGGERDDTSCGSGLGREAEPTLVGVSAFAAAGLEMAWESCACQAWGQLQRGLR